MERAFFDFMGDFPHANIHKTSTNPHACIRLQ